MGNNNQTVDLATHATFEVLLGFTANSAEEVDRAVCLIEGSLCGSGSDSSHDDCRLSSAAIPTFVEGREHYSFEGFYWFVSDEEAILRVHSARVALRSACIPAGAAWPKRS